LICFPKGYGTRDSPTARERKARTGVIEMHHTIQA